MLSDLLSLRTQTPAPPPELRDVFDSDRYRRSQAYMRSRTRFGAIASTVQLLILLLFWFAGGFGWIDRATRALGFGSIVTGLAFIGALGLARLLVGLPFAAWSTFVIEERFGFNRTTVRTLVVDRVTGRRIAQH